MTDAAAKERIAILSKFCNPTDPQEGLARPWSYRRADWATDGCAALTMRGPIVCKPLTRKASYCWLMARLVQKIRRRKAVAIKLTELRRFLRAAPLRYGRYRPFIVGSNVVNGLLVLKRLNGLASDEVVIRVSRKRLDPIQISDAAGDWTLYVMPLAEYADDKMPRLA